MLPFRLDDLMLAPTRCAALLLTALFSASVARGQEPTPARLQRAALANGEAVDLVLAWRFHPGDDSSFGRARFSARTGHVLAVRYELRAEQPVGRAAAERGFRLSLETTDAAARALAAERRRATLGTAFVALPSFLALLHLALYWSYPKSRENLFYSLSMAAFAGIVVCDLETSRAASGTWRELALRAATPFTLAAIFFVLLTFLAVRTTRLPRTWIGFAVAGLGLAAWSWFDPNPLLRSWAWYVYFGAMTVEIFRVGRSAETAPREGVSVLRAGLIINGAIIALQILINLGVVPPIAGTRGVYVFGMLALAVAMSLFLARSFARTSIHLEQRLAEVRDLSEQVLVQQLAAHQQEIHRLLLHAEHARKSAEIAAARELQLSMRPASLPQVPGLETAATMTTATEIGGDYYDFKIDEAGGLIVALGDATGHGVAAGTMVTAIKALFSVLGVGESLPRALAECSRVLRGMNARQLHMCLLLARITPRGVTVCSAAMPPALLYRAATAEVEELGAGGLPLGTRLDAAWEERHAELAPGDTLVFATDGLTELLDPTGMALGFDGAATALRKAGGAGAPEVIRSLMEHATAWRADHEPTDDLTLVAVRVSR